MCIILTIDAGQKHPDKKTLQTCFNNNDDGCGYMYNDGGYVHIRKGFMTFDEFYKDYKAAKEAHKKSSFILHFRISTQAGVRADCCHPYPLTADIEKMRALAIRCKIGVAHNGIISLCTTYDKKITYNDTMQFISEYLSLIIRSKDFYKDTQTIKLIDKLAGSRLAFMDSDGHITRTGSGWTEDGGIWYSNTTYTEARKTYNTLAPYTYNYTTAYDYAGEYWEAYKNVVGDTYDFDEYYCPYTEDGDDSYCKHCSNYTYCWAYDIDDDNDNINGGHNKAIKR